jgi:hypothetical protein
MLDFRHYLIYVVLECFLPNARFLEQISICIIVMVMEIRNIYCLIFN